MTASVVRIDRPREAGRPPLWVQTAGQRVGGIARHRRYTRFVRLMRVVLPLAALALLGIVFLAADRNSPDSQSGPPGAAAGGAGAHDDMRMVNPSYVGADDENRRYAVTARSALLDPSDPSLVTLQQPAADVALGDGTVTIEAGSGVYRRAEETLDLADGIVLRSASGYSVRTPTAHVDLAAGVANGTASVEADGPLGTLEAQGFHISGDGNVIAFGGHGRVRVVLTPQ
jgi:lipopolysaccharide export system protein LptC